MHPQLERSGRRAFAAAHFELQSQHPKMPRRYRPHKLQLGGRPQCLLHLPTHLNADPRGRVYAEPDQSLCAHD
jgi:hypothetical protein